MVVILRLLGGLGNRTRHVILALKMIRFLMHYDVEMGIIFSTRALYYVAYLNYDTSSVLVCNN